MENPDAVLSVLAIDYLLELRMAPLLAHFSANTSAGY
jgi:hypothetical protein